LHLLNSHVHASRTKLFSRSPIKDLAIPFTVSLTSNPITLLDGLRIRIFQKAKLARFSPCVFPSFHFAFIFLLVRVTFTCTTPIIAISSNSLLPFTPADVEIPFRYSNSFISSRAGSLIFFLFTPEVFSGEKSGVMLHVVACFYRAPFPSTRGLKVTRRMTRKTSLGFCGGRKPQ